jgi:hypothetical protein
MEDLRGYDEREYFENIAREVESKPMAVRATEHQAFIGGKEDDISTVWRRIAAKDVSGFSSPVSLVSSSKGGARRAFDY